MEELKIECDECGHLHDEDDFVDCCDAKMCGRMICKYCKELEKQSDAQ